MKTQTVTVRTSGALGAGLVVLSSFFYASYGIWTTLLGDALGGYTASALRSVLVLLLLVPMALAYRQLGPVEWRRNWRPLVALVLSAVLIWGPLYYAILHAGVGVSLAVNYASIVIGMAFFGWLLVDERITQRKWISIILGMVGLGLVFSPSMSGIGWLTLGGAVISGLSTAAQMVIAKKLPYNATQSTVLTWTASVIANTPMAFILHETQTVLDWRQWTYLLLFAVASVIASWSLVKAMKRIEAGTAGILGLLEIVFGVAFGVLLFGERPGLTVLLGVAVIIVAAAVPYLKGRGAEGPKEKE